MAIDIEQIKNDYEEEQGDFETLPVDTYPCYVYDLEGQVSSNGNPMIAITLKVAKGEYKNRQLWTNVTLTPKAWWKVEEFFEAVDYDIEELPAQVDSPEEIVATIRENVVGSKVEVEVGHREWEGETRENVESVNPPSEDFDIETEGDEDIPF